MIQGVASFFLAGFHYCCSWNRNNSWPFLCRIIWPLEKMRSEDRSWYSDDLDVGVWCDWLSTRLVLATSHQLYLCR